MTFVPSIKIICLDIDGTLTDGSLYFGDQGEALKVFSVKDGYGIKAALKKEIPVFLLTARKAYPPTIKRLQDLDLDPKYLQDEVLDKVACAQDLLSAYNLSWNEMAYMGDDLPDLPLLQRVGLAAAPADALEEIKEKAHFISDFAGGKGAVRQFIDYILKQN